MRDEWLALGGISRLASFGEVKDGKMKLAEIRCAGGKMRFHDWDDPEPSISIYSLGVISHPPAFAIERSLIADIGLHALARHFQRASRDDGDVLRHLLPLVGGYKGAVAAGGDFRIAAGGGAWIGEVTTVRGKPVLAVRTFVT